MILRPEPCTRQCSAIAEEESELFELDLRHLFKVFNIHRMSLCGKLVNFLREFELFRKVQKETLFINSQYFDEVSYEYGRHIYREGEHSNYIYLILGGKFLESKKITIRDISKYNNINKHLQSNHLKRLNIYKDLEVRILEGGLVSVKDCLVNGITTRSLKCVSETGTVLQINCNLLITVFFVGWKIEALEKLCESYETEFFEVFYKKWEFYQKYQTQVLGLNHLVNATEFSSVIKKGLPVSTEQEKIESANKDSSAALLRSFNAESNAWKSKSIMNYSMPNHKVIDAPEATNTSSYGPNDKGSRKNLSVILQKKNDQPYFPINGQEK